MMSRRLRQDRSGLARVSNDVSHERQIVIYLVNVGYYEGHQESEAAMWCRKG
jgi:hypothetical protein